MQAPWDNFPTGNLNSAKGEEIMKMFKQLNDEGTTIVQVTHAEKNAGCGKRTIHLLDGRIEKKTVLWAGGESGKCAIHFLKSHAYFLGSQKE